MGKKRGWGGGGEGKGEGTAQSGPRWEEWPRGEGVVGAETGSEAGLDPSGLKSSGGQGFIPRATGVPLLDSGWGYTRPSSFRALEPSILTCPPTNSGQTGQ